MKSAAWFFAGALTASMVWLIYLGSVNDRLLCMLLGSGC
jgi:arginine exporter protein ArgO